MEMACVRRSGVALYDLIERQRAEAKRGLHSSPGFKSTSLFFWLDSGNKNV